MEGHPLPALQDLRQLISGENQKGFLTLWADRLAPHSPPQLPGAVFLVCQTCTESLLFPSLPHQQHSHTLPGAVKWHCPWTSEIVTLKKWKG